MTAMTAGALGIHGASRLGAAAVAPPGCVPTQPPSSASPRSQSPSRSRNRMRQSVGQQMGVVNPARLSPSDVPCLLGGPRMTRIDPVWATVAELSAAYTARTLSPLEVVDALLARIRKRDPVLHAFIAVHEAEARLAAEAADKAIRSGHRVGPLHGVPIALKDLVDLQGRVTTGGSKVWKDRISPATATLAERLIAAGRSGLGQA